MPYIGNQPGTGVRSRFIYTATASQTTFSGADDNSKTLKYSDADYIDVYLNGVCLVPVTDYAASTKTSVVLTQAASLNDTLEVVAYDIATISDTVSKANGGTFNGDLGITNASPDITLTNNTTEDTDGGRESTVTFKGLQSGGEESTLAEIRASHDGTADDEKGDLIFKTNDGSDGASPTETLRLKNDGNLLLGTTVSGRAAEGADRLTIADAAHSGLTIRSGSTSYGSINFSDSEGGVGEYAGSIFFGHGASLGEKLTIGTAGTNRVSIDSAGFTVDPSNAGGQFGVFNTSSSGDGHILLKRNSTNEYQIGSGTSDQFFIYNYNNSAYALTISNTGTFNVQGVYNDTTTSSANVNVASDGHIRRVVSSRRYKNTITDATHGLTELLTLRPVTYKGNNEDFIVGGLIAEEVHDAGLTEFVEYDDDNQPDSLAYSNMVSLCIKAIQEQQATITAQAAKIETLETQNTTQATQIADLITRVAALEAG